MNRWLRILLIVAAVLAVAALLIFWPVQEDLDDLSAVADNYDATILRDTWGVPHVFGETDADAAFALAYAHSEDDFLTIQQTLVAARGTLGSVYGADAAPNDYMVALIGLWDALDAKYETEISAETRTMLTGYADGLNLYAANHPDDVLPGLFPVSGKDVVAGFMHKTPLFYGLDGALGDLFAEETPEADASASATASWQATAYLHQPSPADGPEVSRYGSNTFAVAPSRTPNGETFLAVNAHQPWEGPVTWYEAHVHSNEGWDAVGGIFPGAPAILHGHNRDLGWAFTVNSPDLIDIYELEINPDNPDQYFYEGEWHDLELETITIWVHLIGNLRIPVRQEIAQSVYGPTVRRPQGTFAIRAVGLGEVGLVEQWYRMNKATTLEEWQTAMREGPLPMFNAGYADKTGNIYYVYNAKLPLRSEGYDWEGTLPATSAETLWTDTLPFDDLPQVLNPASGFVQNANSTPFSATIGAGNPDPADYSDTFGIERYETNRSLRALTLFDQPEPISAELFAAYKYDMVYDPASDVATAVAQVSQPQPGDSAEMTAARTLLREWDLEASAESRATALAVLMLYFVDQSGEAELNFSRLAMQDEISAEVLNNGLAEAVAFLQEHFGRIDPPWEEVNRLRRGDVDLGLAGGPDLLHAIYGLPDEDGRLHGFNGDSYVLLVSWDAEGNVRSESIHQYGSATLDESSPHYNDQSPLFARRELKPVWLDEADIRANLQRAYRPGEEMASEGGS